MASNAWSYSALNTYETCPKKYYHERIAKDVVQTSSSQADYGTDAHKAFELLFTDGTPLPLQLQHHNEMLSALLLRASKCTVLAEHKMAVTVDLAPTDFDADDAWSCGIADLALIGKRTAVVLDWKFGRPHENYGQLELMAFMVMCHHAFIDSVNVAFYWAKERRLAGKKLDRDTHMTAIYNDFLARAGRMRTDSKFAPKPNGLCRKWCPVKTCSFNGG
jgi:hypothetical protein